MENESVKRYIKAELKAQKKYSRPLSEDLYQSYKDEIQQNLERGLSQAEAESKAEESLRKSLKEIQLEKDGTLLSKTKEKEVMKYAHARRKPLYIVMSSVTVLLSLLMLFAFFPLLPIYGYSHDAPSENSTTMITVTSSSIFMVMQDSFYSNGIKIAYSFFFSFQIISIGFTAFLLIKTIRGTADKVVSLLLMLPLFVTEILSLILFSRWLPIPTSIGIVCLAITVVFAVLLLIKKEDVKDDKIS